MGGTLHRLVYAALHSVVRQIIASAQKPGGLEERQSYIATADDRATMVAFFKQEEWAALRSILLILPGSTFQFKFIVRWGSDISDMLLTEEGQRERKMFMKAVHDIRDRIDVQTNSPWFQPTEGTIDLQEYSEPTYMSGDESEEDTPPRKGGRMPAPKGTPMENPRTDECRWHPRRANGPRM